MKTIKQYSITASSTIGGIENRGWCLDWKGNGWNSPWSDDNRIDNEYFETLEEAKEIVDYEQSDFDEFTTLSVDFCEFDEEGEIIAETPSVYEVKGTKEL